MTPRVSRCIAAAPLVAIAICVGAAAQSLPTKISDRDFWAMVEGLSESGGAFVTDNRVSNEIAFQQVIPELQRHKQVAYLGVGPEQNFTYIAALKPRIAFIVDLRRQNLLLHLVYKALVELSTDRTEFMSRLFARPRPGGTGPDSTPRALFSAYSNISPSEALAQSTLAAIVELLKETHGFPLTDEDERSIAEVYRSLYVGGPDLRGNFGGGSWIPSYADLMSQSDLTGRNHSFLASEADYLVLKEYQTRNLIVPIVGDFSGGRAVRGVGQYLAEHGATVTTFYLSNVEEYLFKSNSWSAFVRNVSSLPTDDQSMFIRTYFTRNEGLQTLLDPIRGTLDAFENGQIKSYADIVFRSKTPIP
jgi:hypothetical protein